MVYVLSGEYCPRKLWRYFDENLQQNSMGGQSCRSSSSYIEDDRPEQLTTAIVDPIKMVVDAEEEVGDIIRKC